MGNFEVWSIIMSSGLSEDDSNPQAGVDISSKIRIEIAKIDRVVI